MKEGFRRLSLLLGGLGLLLGMALMWSSYPTPPGYPAAVSLPPDEAGLSDADLWEKKTREGMSGYEAEEYVMERYGLNSWDADVYQEAIRSGLSPQNAVERVKTMAREEYRNELRRWWWTTPLVLLLSGLTPWAAVRAVGWGVAGFSAPV